MQVNQKTRLRVQAELRPQVADALRQARASLGFTQTELAQALGASQGAITRWERQIDSPPISAISMLAQMVPDAQKGFWITAGAIVDRTVMDSAETRTINVLRDSAAAGTPRALDESEIDFKLLFPTRLLPSGGQLVGLKVEGESMSPLLESGYIVIIDTSLRKPESLAGRMVAARNSEGVTIKWLRKKGNLFLLVPQNTSPRHQIEIIGLDGDWTIVGEVVKWIGEPHATKRKV